MNTTTTASVLWRTLRSDKRQWQSLIDEIAERTYAVMDVRTKDSDEWREIRAEMVAAVVDEMERRAKARRKAILDTLMAGAKGPKVSPAAKSKAKRK